MGAGGSREAAYGLRTSIAAGRWDFVGDGIIVDEVDVTVELIHRHGGDDTTLATWQRHFAPLGGGQYTAQAWDEDADLPALSPEPGDELVLRYTGESSTSSVAYIPNGDGATASGRIPHLVLPAP